MALPRFMVLRSSDEKDFLGYVRDVGESYEYLRFMETEATSPYARFEVETSSKDAQLVHIRSCLNNKYFVRTKNLSITGNPVEQYWITASANKPEEDQSKEWCTLFKPISVDLAANTFRIMHVQSGCYLCVWRLSVRAFTRPVLANYPIYDHQQCDIFTVIDWMSLLVLPKYVAFKGDNDKYLCLREIDGHPYLTFAADYIGDSTVPFEVFVTPDGNIRIKPTSSNYFWRRSNSDWTWIWSDSNDTSNNDKDTLFRPVKVDDKTIALLNLGNNKFCKRLAAGGITNGLSPFILSVDIFAKLRVEEPIMTREIYNVRYNLDNSRVYDEQVLVLAKNSAVNFTRQPSAFDFILRYTNTKTSTWNTLSSLKLGTKAANDFSLLPLIVDGKTELFGEVQSGVEWGETKTSNTIVEVVHKVVVPPMTKVTVNLMATNGKCDVPFTFVQRDTLYNGKVVTTQVQGGVYTGSNYYNLNFQTKAEKLTACGCACCCGCCTKAGKLTTCGCGCACASSLSAST